MGELTLEWLWPDGRAGGRDADGRVVRVAGGVPGDVVAAGDHEEPVIVRPSPSRRTPPCPWSADCGGCDLDMLAPVARREALARMVGFAFGVRQAPPIVASPRQEGARARIKLALEDGAVGYRAPRSRRLVPVETCRIARPELQQAHQRLLEWVAREQRAGLQAVELRTNGARTVFAFTSAGPVPRATREALAELGDVALDGKRVAGDPTLVFDVLGCTLRARPSAFFQVNLEVNEALVAHVRDAVLEADPEAVLDLYAGIGNLSLPIAAAGPPVVAVEAPGPAVDDLRDNARPFPGVDVVARRVERFEPSRTAFDVVVLDPPRIGARGVLASVSRNRPRRVVYVSCNPPAAARDLRELRGYRLVDLTCFELFLDSRHVEAVAVLDRG